MRRVLLACLTAGMAVVGPQVVEAQSLSSQLDDLFLFGDCGGRLCLELDPFNDHADHFTGDATRAGDLVIGFLTGALGLSLGNLPFASANSGTLLTVEGGNLVQTEVSPGPIYSERALTLGKGRLFLAANVAGVSFSEIRGISSDDLSFTFAHVDDNLVLGDRDVENDLIRVNMSLDVSVIAASLMVAYGISDQVDMSFQVPIVRSSLNATSQGFIDENTPGSANHRFFDTGGTISSSTSISGSAVGIGDIGLRIKVNAHTSRTMEAGFLADVRLPTGDEDDFLGSGGTTIRALGLISGRKGAFSPHLNLGLGRTGGVAERTSFLGAAGFDLLLGPNAAFVADVLANVELSDSELVIPEDVTFAAGRSTVIGRTNLPVQKDHLIDASLGIKIQAAEGVRISTNALVPLSTGGTRGSLFWTLGFEVLR